MFEVKFERSDPVPMKEVIKYPTATELDDYSEYKRLRKAHRDGKRKVNTASSIKLDSRTVPESSIRIPTVQTKMIPGVAPKKTWGRSPSASQKTTFKDLQFNEPSQVSITPGHDIVSPKKNIGRESI